MTTNPFPRPLANTAAGQCAEDCCDELATHYADQGYYSMDLCRECATVTVESWATVYATTDDEELARMGMDALVEPREVADLWLDLTHPEAAPAVRELTRNLCEDWWGVACLYQVYPAAVATFA